MISFNVLTIEDPEFTVKIQCRKKILWTKTEFSDVFLHENETPVWTACFCWRLLNRSLDTKRPNGTFGGGDKSAINYTRIKFKTCFNVKKKKKQQTFASSFSSCLRVKAPFPFHSSPNLAKLLWSFVSKYHAKCHWDPCFIMLLISLWYQGYLHRIVKNDQLNT